MLLQVTLALPPQLEGQWSEVLLTSLYNITAQQAERQAYQVRVHAAAWKNLSLVYVCPINGPGPHNACPTRTRRSCGPRWLQTG